MKSGLIKTFLGIVLLLIFIICLTIGLANNSVTINVIFSDLVQGKYAVAFIYILFYFLLAIGGIAFMVWGILSIKKNNEKTSAKTNTYKIVFLGLMAAIVFVITELRFPLGESQVHFANGMCLLSGMMFGGVPGGIAAGFGSALYDALSGRYDILDIIVTFVSKFLMAYAAGAIYFLKRPKVSMTRSIIASVAGALLYVALYMLKTLVFGLTIDGLQFDAVTVKMLAKLPASLINAIAAMISAPILNEALQPSLRKLGILKKIS